ncbi:MAG: hypothetical protein ACT4O1_08305 [Gemmatimonadota bacterium]
MRQTSVAKAWPVWLVASAGLLWVATIVLWPSRADSDRANNARVPVSQVEAHSTQDLAAPPQLTGSPREQADRLFNRVMTERANGDTARARFFLPMAIQAYEIAGDPDADGWYHLSLLQAFSGDDFAARKSAERILATAPNHLLGLAAAADAARAGGDAMAARNYYRRFLAAYESESKRDLPEYRDHARNFAEVKSVAESYVRE